MSSKKRPDVGVGLRKPGCFEPGVFGLLITDPPTFGLPPYKLLRSFDSSVGFAPYLIHVLFETFTSLADFRAAAKLVGSRTIGTYRNCCATRIVAL